MNIKEDIYQYIDKTMTIMTPSVAKICTTGFLT
jgi:hypothetical protein